MSYNYPGPPQGPPYPPGPYPQGPFPQGPQMPPPPRKRRRGCLYAFLGVAGGLVLLVVIIGIVVAAVSGNNGTSSGTATGSGGTGGSGNSEASAGIGSKVRDGKFQFTVTKIAHATRVGPRLLGKKAQGRFTILYVTVTNIGSESQTLDDGSQYVFDSKGRKFSADSEADILINGSGNSVFLNDINPGNTVHGKIVFDLPKRDHAVKAELHDSAFSNGVTVSLAG
jgi:hypothetical protein